MDDEQTSKIRQLVMALMRSDQSQRQASARPIPVQRKPLPQMGGMSGQAQQDLQNRGNQLNRAIDEAS
jgi:hypothetical protein